MPSIKLDETNPSGWTSAEIESLTNGKWLAAPIADRWLTAGICAEPSQCAESQMLLAPSGAAGLRPGALAKLAARSRGIVAEKGEAYLRFGVPVLEVSDLRDSVTRLAIAARREFQGVVVAVTGSVGKTTTVAMAAHALAGLGTSDRSRTSANSPYGIGWNLASMRRDASYWVQEMAIGRMDVCSRLVRPQVAIVTAIAPAHLASFGNTDNIARLKARVYQGMQPGGIAVINRDMPEYPIFEAAAREAGLRVVGFGSTSDCDAQFVSFDGKAVHAVIADRQYSFALGAPGRHMAMNALAVLAAVAALGGDIALAASRFASFQPLAGRGKRTAARFEGKRIEIWDDSFNANPASMRAALETMRSATSVPAASRLLILGDMLELGPDEGDMHLDLKADIMAVGADRILFCGPLMEGVANLVLRETKGRWFPDVSAVEQALKPWIHNGDTVLLKASHGTHLERIVTMLGRTADE